MLPEPATGRFAKCAADEEKREAEADVGRCSSAVLEDVDTLIMSPTLFARHPIRAPSDVERHVLLASETRPGEWIDWLETAGLSHLVGRPRRVFDHFFVTRQAVEDGLGIGIGPLPLLEIDVASGRIMTPLPEIRVRRTGYVALTALNAERTESLTAFLDWLAAEQGRVRSVRPSTLPAAR
jgi:LysR family glycine cleavage system transcriptional activator